MVDRDVDVWMAKTGDRDHDADCDDGYGGRRYGNVEVDVRWNHLVLRQRDSVDPSHPLDVRGKPPLVPKVPA